jgi:hypothetical protein
MKCGATPISGLALVFSFFVGMIATWYVGPAFFILCCGVLFVVIGYRLDPRPRCGQVWWSGMGGVGLGGWLGP